VLPLRHRRFWRIASATLIALVVYGSLAPAGLVPLPGDGFDKLEHFGAYCVLAVWFTGLYPRSRYGLVVVALLATGLVLEFAQGAMQWGRSAEALDMLANTVGVGAGLALGMTLTGSWAGRVEWWLARR
jgi:VanZ family protein